MNTLNEFMFRWRVIWYFIPYIFALALAHSTYRVIPDIFIFFIGIGLSILGQALRIWGAGFVEEVARKNTVSYLPLVITGPYKFIRHPLYLGNILSMIGFAISAVSFISFPVNIITLLTCSLLAIIIMVSIIKHEETALRKLHGKVYTQYCHNTPQLIPTFRTLKRDNSQHSSFSFVDAFKNETHVIGFKVVLFIFLW